MQKNNIHISNLSTKLSDQTIVFFDGSCNLCHSIVQFLSGRKFADKLEFLDFNSQESDAYYEISTPFRQSLSVMVKQNNRIVTNGPAIKAIAGTIYHRNPILQITWRIVTKVLDSFPDFLLNTLYNHIAKRRHRIFGRRQANCHLIDP
jgi:predicted DCC family thiol-disulfide oxidoreductase YuxK